MIIVIWSSPNKDGLTATAKNKIIEGLSALLEAGEKFSLMLKTIQRK